MATVDNSKPIYRATCGALMKKMARVQLAMLEHVGSGCQEKGLSNSFMLRTDLWDLKLYIDKVLEVETAKGT